jgi:Abnormal spindle-like microcephaly-assoc'd, ASPM-SPD-2-Hydin
MSPTMAPIHKIRHYATMQSLKTIRTRLGLSEAAAFLALDVLYVAVLVVLLVGRQAHWFWLDRIHNPIGGIIPLGVPWFGALGAVTVSIYGVVDHASNWMARWNLWHVIRPVVGAILGTVAYLIFIGVIQATGTTPSAVGSSPSIKLITYLVIAFVVGFREQTFRSLVKRVVDILLSPGDEQKAPAVSISPSPVSFGSVASGQPSTSIVTVTNTGSAALVVHGASSSPPGTAIAGAGFGKSNDAVAGATINPGSSALLTVTLTPPAAGPQEGILTISCNAGTFPVTLAGTGA